MIMDPDDNLHLAPRVNHVATADTATGGPAGSMQGGEEAPAQTHETPTHGTPTHGTQTHGKWKTEETTDHSDRHRKPVPLMPLILLLISAGWAVMLAAVYVAHSRTTADATLKSLADSAVCASGVRQATVPAAGSADVSPSRRGTAGVIVTSNYAPRAGGADQLAGLATGESLHRSLQHCQ